MLSLSGMESDAAPAIDLSDIVVNAKPTVAEPAPVFHFPPLFRAPPPMDNAAVHRFHGRTIKDPFRPLENLADDKIRPWINLQRLILKRFIDPALVERITEEKCAAREAPQAPALDYFWQDDVKGIWVAPGNGGRHGDHFYVVQKYEEHDCLARFDRQEEVEILFLSSDFADLPGCRIEGAWIDQRERYALCRLIDKEGGRRRDALLRLRGGEMLENFPPIDFAGWETAGFGLYYRQTGMGVPGGQCETLYYHRIGYDWAGDLALVRAGGNPHPTSFTVRLFLLSGTTIYVQATRGDRYGEVDEIYLIDRENPGRLIALPPLSELLPAYGRFVGADQQYSYAALRKGKTYDIVRLRHGAAHWREATILLGDAELRDGECVYFKRGKLGVIVNQDLQNILLVIDRDGRLLHRFVPATPSTLYFIIAEGNRLVFCGSHYMSIHARYTLDLDTFAMTTEEDPAPFWLEDVIVTREMVPASDGALVPLTIVRHKDTALDGSAPAILHAYGGFANCLVPRFDDSWAYWVRRRGVMAIAHIRGDGGWLPGWSAAGTGLNRQRSLGDFCDCAAWLVTQGYTQESRLVAIGASNGGMTVAAAALQRPDLFGAVVSLIPILDMLNLALSRGEEDRDMWLAEYGAPQILAEFETLLSFSPLHNVRRGVAYPPTLVMAGEGDTRAYPGHALKFVATMQDLAGPESAYLYLKPGAGHDDFFERAEADVMDAAGVMFAFIERVTGLDARRRILHALHTRVAAD